jgi:serine/threonine-protein kinase PRP4
MLYILYCINYILLLHLNFVGDQYQTMGIVGKGVFSIVIKCVDLKVKDGDPVAIKVIRNNDTMRKAAEKERSILSMIKDRDPENRRHCVRLLSHFEFRNHVALVFDYQQMNLRETLKKFGKDVGINIGAVRMYARQLLVALRHLADLKIVHADIKLDNILCSGDLKQVKLCDFGSAFRETDTDNDPTPYLVSRFYRAPEIILGLPCKFLEDVKDDIAFVFTISDVLYCNASRWVAYFHWVVLHYTALCCMT